MVVCDFINLPCQCVLFIPSTKILGWGSSVHSHYKDKNTNSQTGSSKNLGTKKQKAIALADWKSFQVGRFSLGGGRSSGSGMQIGSGRAGRVLSIAPGSGSKGPSMPSQASDDSLTETEWRDAQVILTSAHAEFTKYEKQVSTLLSDVGCANKGDHMFVKLSLTSN